MSPQQAIRETTPHRQRLGCLHELSVWSMPEALLTGMTTVRHKQPLVKVMADDKQRMLETHCPSATSVPSEIRGLETMFESSNLLIREQSFIT